MKKDHFKYFLQIGSFPKSLEQFKGWIILSFLDIVNFVFNFVPNCFLSMILSSKQGRFSLLKMLLFLIFVLFWTFSLTFKSSLE